MKTFITSLILLFIPAIVFGQPDGGTDTSTVGLEEVLGTIPGIVGAFTDGNVLLGISLAFAALGVALNFGPLKSLIAGSKYDWVRPALMLVVVGATAGIGSAMAGADALGAILMGIMAGVGSGYIQKIIQEYKD